MNKLEHIKHLARVKEQQRNLTSLKALREQGELPELEQELFFVWSVVNSAWWRPKSAGYTLYLESAGRYTSEEAVSICRGRDGYNGEQVPSEVMVPCELMRQSIR